LRNRSDIKSFITPEGSKIKTHIKYTAIVAIVY